MKNKNQWITLIALIVTIAYDENVNQNKSSKISRRALRF